MKYILHKIGSPYAEAADFTVLPAEVLNSAAVAVSYAMRVSHFRSYGSKTTFS